MMKVRIRWVGSNPNTGLPWKDSWSEAFAKDSEGVFILNPALRREARVLERQQYGVRAPGPRVAKVVPPRAPADGRWKGRFRSDKRGNGELLPDGFRRVRQRVRIWEEDMVQESEVDRALADVRRQRSEVAALYGQGPRRRKRWAVLEDSEDEMEV